MNFLGPRDEFVASGSDDGNLFIWDKDTGKLHDILEGDGHVVNVIEGHPYLPLVAVSGIDTTVKVRPVASFGISRNRSGNAIHISGSYLGPGQNLDGSLAWRMQRPLLHAMLKLPRRELTLQL